MKKHNDQRIDEVLKNLVGGYKFKSKLYKNKLATTWETLMGSTISKYTSRISVRNKKLFVTIEEHNIIGGLGSAISEETAKLGNGPKHIFFGINDEYSHHGDYKHLLQSYGLTPEKIVNKIKKNL